MDWKIIAAWVLGIVLVINGIIDAYNGNWVGFGTSIGVGILIVILFGH